MKKKIKNEDVKNFLQAIVDDIRYDMTKEFNIAKSEMRFAEIELYQSLDQKQRELYEEFEKKRELFYETAKQIYERKIN